MVDFFKENLGDVAQVSLMLVIDGDDVLWLFHIYWITTKNKRAQGEKNTFSASSSNRSSSSGNPGSRHNLS